MSNMIDVWVYEWSVSQKCGHIHTVFDMIKTNRSISTKGDSVDYLVVAIGTREQMDSFAVSWADNMEEQNG